MTEQTLRLFVSSTFRDMHAERDYLNRFVFPDLRDRCRRRGVEFVAVDLRWGLTEEQTRREGALRLCLEELAHCHLFLGLLGERYGWQPVPAEVSLEQWESCRGDERPGLLERWYRLDETALPPVYRLRGDVTPAPQEAQALVRFWEARGLPHAGESITEREMQQAVFEGGIRPGAALAYLRRPGLTDHPDFPPGLVAVFRESDPENRTRLERLKGRLRQDAPGCTVRDYEPGYAGLRLDPALLPATLSAAERQALRDGVLQPGDWTGLGDAVRRAVMEHGTVALSGLEAFGQRVLEDLWQAVEAHLGEAAVQETDAGLAERQRRQHESFAADRGRLFVGRQELLARLLAYAAADERLPLVVTGPAGAGKSALLGRFVVECRRRLPSALVVPCFVGAVPGSTQLSATLRSLLETLRREAALEDEIPADPRRLRPLLPVFLEKAAAGRPVVLVLDAVNQLDPADRPEELGWFPLSLPPGVHVVASTLPGTWLEKLRERVDAQHLLAVPPLPADERQALAEQHLRLRGKRLAPGQMERLLDCRERPDAALPLYLLTALEELCLFGSHEALGERIGRLPATLPDLLEQVLARLEHDHGYQAVAAVCGWLAAARSGLSESELLDLLGRHVPACTPLRWSQLYHALRFYLRPAGESALIGFFHDQLRVAVCRRYLEMEAPDQAPTPVGQQTHRVLASYFQAVAREGDSSWRADRPRALGELPYHLVQAAAWGEVEQTLCDLRFIEAGCVAGLVHGLVEDCTRALDARPASRQAAEEEQQRLQRLDRYSRELVAHAREETARHPHLQPPGPRGLAAAWRAFRAWLSGRFIPPAAASLPEPPAADAGERAAAADPDGGRIHAFAHFVSVNLRALLTVPGETACLARNHAAGGVVAQAGEALTRVLTRPWLARDPRPPESPARPALLRAWPAENSSQALAMTPDGRLAVSGGPGGTLRFWDVATGQCLRTLEGHNDADTLDRSIAGVALTPDGRLLLSAGRDRTLRAWDAATGQCLQRMQADRAYGVYAVAVTPDGRLAVSGGADGVVRLWDVSAGRCLRELPGHKGHVRWVAIQGSGRLAVSGCAHGTVRVWDLWHGRCRHLLTGHQGEVTALGLFPDGRRLLTGGADRTVRLWDTAGGACLRSWATGHGRQWTIVAATPDGRLAFVGSADGELSVWELETGRCLRRLERPGESVRALAVTPDGRLALTAGLDDTLRAWDLGGDPGPPPLPGHGAKVRAVLTARQGRLAFSAGWDKAIRVWDTATGACLRSLERPSESVDHLAVTPDGHHVAAGHQMTVWVWDARTGRLLRTLPLEGDSAVDGVALTPDGKQVLAGHCHDHRPLRVWDVAGGQCLHVFPTGRGSGIGAMTPDGRLLLTAVRDGRLGAWDVAARQCLRLLENDELHVQVSCVGVTEDGREAVTRDVQGAVRVWDLATGQPVRSVQADPWGPPCLGLSPDGRLAATGDRDRTVVVWDLLACRQVATYFAAARVTALSPISPDGRLACGTEDGQLHFLILHNTGTLLGRATPR